MTDNTDKKMEVANQLSAALGGGLTGEIKGGVDINTTIHRIRSNYGVETSYKIIGTDDFTIGSDQDYWKIAREFTSIQLKPILRFRTSEYETAGFRN